MPEDSTPPESTPQPPESTSSQPSEAEWTDDIDSSPLESDVVPPINQEATPDVWERDELDWEDEVTPPQEPEPQVTSTREALAWLTPVWRRGIATWRRILAGVRSRIPAVANLSDTILSGILLGGLVLLLVLVNSVRQPSAAANVPVADTPIADTPAVTPPATTSEVEADPTDEPTIAPDDSASTPTPETTAEAPELDPAERDRMAAIQAQLTSGALSNGNGLVESVQADFTHNQLTVNLTNGWYRLSTYEQEELANTFKQRSGEMAFDDVELRSPNGDLLARNPVVGNNMIILQHEKPPTVEPPPRPRYRITIER
ncbi:MAG: hypothetical protein ACFBSF_22665 [Leptolyngbyaceae cyanobacterium]